jgi:hypothetical protein
MVVDGENTDAARINAHYLLFSLRERAENPVPVRRLVRKKTGILNSISLRTSQPQSEVPAQPDGGEGLEMMGCVATARRRSTRLARA